jgi:hypothetical protein
MSMHFLQGAILRIAGDQVWKKESERWRAVSMCLGNSVWRTADIASDTVINFWCHAGLGWSLGVEWVVSIVSRSRSGWRPIGGWD